MLTATGLVDAGLLDVGGGYGSTGASIDADGNITTNGYLDVDLNVRVGGGYATNGSGTTLGSNGSISSNGNMLVEGTATFKGLTLVQTANGNGARVYVSDTSSAIGGFRPYIAGVGDSTADFLWNNTTKAWNSDQGLSTNARTDLAATQASGAHISNTGYGIFSVDAADGNPCYLHKFNATGTARMVQFIYNGTSSGVINTTSGGTPAFASGSDYRIKEDVQPVTDALERMKGIQAYTFRKIKEVDPEQNLQTGFIAHEVQAVHPEAVIGEKDAVDEEGNPEYQQVMDAKLTPLMAQAIKELILKNEALEARIAALEAR